MRRKIIIGTHNSMSYLPPKNRLLGLLNKWFAQCQTKTLQEQYEAGARCFDMRLYWNRRTKTWNFAHGLIDYGNVLIGDTLSTFGRGTFIRLILERNGNERGFLELCEETAAMYPKLTFIGGYRKSDWMRIYTCNDTNVTQHVGSMAGDARWYERFIPRLYARRCNRINTENNLKKGINLFDFI